MSQINESLAGTGICGPVLSLIHAKDMDEVLAFLERSSYGNQRETFESISGVAAPMAYFPFSGWKGSFFGDLHAQGRDGVESYTDKKVVVERWAAEHSRKF